MELIITKLSPEISVSRVPQNWLLPLDIKDMELAAKLLELAADLGEARDASPIAGADILRIARALSVAAKIAEDDLHADRSEAARHDAEVDAAEKAAQKYEESADLNAAAHE